MAHRVDHDESLAPLGLLACVVSDLFGKASRSNRLAVDDGRGGAALPPVLLPGVGPKSIMDAPQGSVPSPGPEHMEDRFVGRKALGQQVPVTTSLRDIEQSVHNDSKRSSWPTRLSWLGQHRFEKRPLSVGKVGGETCILHRLDTRCRGDVAVSGRVPSQCQNAEPCWFLEDFHENAGFEFSDGLSVKFQSKIGKIYIIEKSLDLITWSIAIDGINGDNSIKSYYFPLEVPKVFYRLKQ